MNSYANSQNWTRELQDLLTPHLTNGFKKLFSQAQRINPEQSCKMFQLCLSRIPDLSLSVLEDDYQMFLDHQNVDPQWLRQMLIGIFATFAKLHLISHGASNNIKLRKSDLRVPDNMTFIHKCYINAARELYTKPYLFSPKISDEMERQRNLTEIKQIINDSISRCLTREIPLQDLYFKYIKKETSEPDLHNPGLDDQKPTQEHDNSTSSSQQRYDRYLRSASRGNSGSSGEDLESLLKEDQVTDRHNKDRDIFLDFKINPRSESNQVGGEPTGSRRESLRDPTKFGGGEPPGSRSDPGGSSHKRTDKSSGLTPKDLVKSRLTRDNIAKLQAELEHQTSGDSSRKNEMLERLIQRLPHQTKTNQIIDKESHVPQSTFDLSLDASMFQAPKNAALAKLTKSLDSGLETASTTTPEEPQKQPSKSDTSKPDTVVVELIAPPIPQSLPSTPTPGLPENRPRRGIKRIIVNEVTGEPVVTEYNADMPLEFNQANIVSVSPTQNAVNPVEQQAGAVLQPAAVVVSQPQAVAVPQSQAGAVPQSQAGAVPQPAQAQAQAQQPAVPDLNKLIDKTNEPDPNNIIVIPIGESTVKASGIPDLSNTNLNLNTQTPEEAVTAMLMKMSDEDIVELLTPLTVSTPGVSASPGVSALPGVSTTPPASVVPSTPPASVVPSTPPASVVPSTPQVSVVPSTPPASVVSPQVGAGQTPQISVPVQTSAQLESRIADRMKIITEMSRRTGIPLPRNLL